MPALGRFIDPYWSPTALPTGKGDADAEFEDQNAPKQHAPFLKRQAWLPDTLDRRHMMIHNRSPQQPERRPIVVGVDGSPGSKAALRWALNQAEQTTATVEAVIVWAPEATFYYGYEWASVADAGDDLPAAADTVLMDTLVEVTGERGRSAPIQPRVRQGRPVAELLRAAGSAQLLVLGGPAHGRIVGLVRGSVSHECLHHAPCPVLIVPATPGVLAASAHADKRGRAAPHPAEGTTL